VSFECISFEGHEYLVARAILASKVKIVMSGGRGPSALQDFKAPDGFSPVVVTNAGIFDKAGVKPQGLFVEHGHEVSPIDLRDCKCSQPDNFYWKPNGVFWIDSKDQPHITDAAEFSRMDVRDVQEATQSGPLLLKRGVIHPDPTTGLPSDGFLSSTSINIRNAVGIGANDEVFLVISQDQTRLVDISRLFRDRLKCLDALYLDGAISEMYIPELRSSVVQQDSGSSKRFVTLIGIVIAQEKGR
jgi:uncharacterized protein YigE (DUF2233 family)